MLNFFKGFAMAGVMFVIFFAAYPHVESKQNEVENGIQLNKVLKLLKFEDYKSQGEMVASYLRSISRENISIRAKLDLCREFNKLVISDISIWNEPFREAAEYLWLKYTRNNELSESDWAAASKIIEDFYPKGN